MVFAARRNVSVRSVWAVNSVRGALAIAAAVTVADLTDVQHGFWVVLGTLSVLRTTASATGATAMRALVGNLAGFVVGAALILAIGTNVTALWLCLPPAVMLASYAPMVLSFAAGQAAFTLLVSILFNILVPVGWKVGVVRVEDVAIGCAVSLVVGVLLWPRGAAVVVADDLGDAFVEGSTYLRQGVARALGRRLSRPDAELHSVDAALRLDDALRGYLAEQGSKRVSKDDLWSLVGAADRLRLTAHALSSLHVLSGSRAALAEHAGAALAGEADAIAGWYQELATHLGRAPPRELAALDGTVLERFGVGDAAGDAPYGYCLLSVAQYLRHLLLNQAAVIEAAGRVGAARRRAWWR